MRIKQLQVSGFKSFLDKTTVSFDVPITGIVGPNGCGKSNVVDALKWVTGELSYKELRGKNSEDLIFAGSEKRPPSSMMEVALKLKNTEKKAPTQYNEFSEITVIRRIFRDGSSEFFINKAPCRLRDITDLFLDTGIGQSSYSIIEQGKVGAIVSGRPEDRRLMIEEAAGITKYKHRKKAALRKMDSTKQNLLRVTDIIKELEKQIASLERQAKKAEKFRIAKQEFESLDIQLNAYEYSIYQTKKNELITQDENLHLALTEIETSLSDIESTFENKRLELDEVENVFQQSQQDLFAKKSDIQGIEHEITSCKNSISYSEKQQAVDEEKMTQLDADVKAMRIRFENIKTELSELDQSKTDIHQELEQKKGLFDAQKGQLSMIESALDEAKKKHIGYVTSRTECRSKIDSLKNNITSIEKDMGEANEALVSFVDEMTHAETEAEEVKVTFDQVKQMCFGFQENQQQIENELADTEALKMEVEKQLSEVRTVMQEKESRLNALTEFTKNYQGYTKTVQNIMKRHHHENAFQGVEGVLGELVHIEEGYEKCVQAALADWIESIVIDDISHASDLVTYLKDDQQARALVLTNTTTPTNQAMLSHPDVKGTLDQWVTVDGSAQLPVVAKLRSVFVVENLKNLIEVSKQHPGNNIVTLEGDYVEATGMLHVGPWSEAHGDLEVRQEIEGLTHELTPLREKYRSLSEEKETIGRKFEQLKLHLEQIAADIKKEDQKSSELGLRLQKLNDKVEFLSKQKAQHIEQIDAYKTKIE
ncbi:MAG: chromosome segregation protein SMC [Deltaproteobacteria bacterium]|nr:chromosome segregation protein SMC [Deltaproteobacteria bacterium]